VRMLPIIFIALLIFNNKVFSQVIESDSISESKKNKKEIYSSARKASVMSAILPGLGQGYNKKYWKIPIIYLGLGGFGYMFHVNNVEYKFYRKNLIALNDEDPSTNNTTFYNSSQLQSEKQRYQKSRDLGLIGMGIIYILNIIDANVDAHLKTFDVSDDLGINISPVLFYNEASINRFANGINLKITF
jgi:hypothetical protein